MTIGVQGLHLRSTVLCLLFFAVIAFGMWSSHAFDDITGYRDGSDLRNYAPERKRSQVKPLVHGQLTVRTAQIFAFATAATAVACVVLFCVVADFRPWWIFVGGLAVVVLGVQYSAGINFSYRFIGGGEAVTGVTLAASVLLPYAAATGRFTAAALIQSVLFGTWLVQVLICSNSSDADDDRQVGRRTVAARTSERANRVFVATVFASTWVLALAGTVWGALSPWTLPALLPAWTLQVYVLRNGIRGQWRNRRNYGFLALRLAVLGLVIVNALD
ncbi:UbiA family prenyltransferase [Streptomyces sp. NPDC048434]|uniref:UbiA family prenyltransferase n=1 Tax=Streptomyces sp. NPDC048434 TaxID=3365549 RepID=UPI003721F758